MTIQYTPKKSNGPQEPTTGQQPGALAGIKQMRPKDFRKASRRDRTVSRAYGGVLSHKSVRDRIVRAFLIEEVKHMKKHLLNKKKAEKPAKKKDAPKKEADKKKKEGEKKKEVDKKKQGDNKKKEEKGKGKKDTKSKRA